MSVTINGKTYEGNSISITDDQIIIDGELVGDDQDGKILRIAVTGTLASLITDRSVTCQNVEGRVEARGSVSANNIKGDVSAGGSVNCGDVSGNVNAGGSVNCDDVGGTVTAGGSVRHS